MPISATFFHAEEVLEVTAHANGVIIMERSTDSCILFCSVDVYLSEFSTQGDSPNPVVHSLRTRGWALDPPLKTLVVGQFRIVVDVDGLLPYEVHA